MASSSSSVSPNPSRLLRRPESSPLERAFSLANGIRTETDVRKHIMLWSGIDKRQSEGVSRVVRSTVVKSRSNFAAFCRQAGADLGVLHPVDHLFGTDGRAAMCFEDLVEGGDYICMSTSSPEFNRDRSTPIALLNGRGCRSAANRQKISLKAPLPVIAPLPRVVTVPRSGGVDRLNKPVLLQRPSTALEVSRIKKGCSVPPSVDDMASLRVRPGSHNRLRDMQREHQRHALRHFRAPGATSRHNGMRSDESGSGVFGGTTFSVSGASSHVATPAQLLKEVPRSPSLIAKDSFVKSVDNFVVSFDDTNASSPTSGGFGSDVGFTRSRTVRRVNSALRRGDLNFPMCAVEMDDGDIVRVEGGHPVVGSVVVDMSTSRVLKVEAVTRAPHPDGPTLCHCRRILRHAEGVMKFDVLAAASIPEGLSFLTNECCTVPSWDLRITSSYLYMCWLDTRTGATEPCLAHEAVIDDSTGACTLCGWQQEQERDRHALVHPVSQSSGIGPVGEPIVF